MQSSAISDPEWPYPACEARCAGYLPEMDGHRVYWEEYGNPGGEPVMFIHGGPGGGTAPKMARFFNPQRYRIILFDQRGCGKSVPSAADADQRPAIHANTTPHLIADMLRLRKALAIRGRMHVFGGSWGSTLALAYAIDHPDTVATLVLRGIFLCRRQDIDFFYQGNAAVWESNPFDFSLSGAYQCYPEAWRRFVSVIPQEERQDMVAAYAHRFAMTPDTEQQAEYLTEVARAWSMWEGVTSYLAQDLADIEKFAEPAFARAFARIENHYFMHGGFLGGESREQNHILENLSALKEIPVIIRHGRYDQVCPLYQAEELADMLTTAGCRVDYRMTVAGHSMFERETCFSLVEAMDTLPAIE